MENQDNQQQNLPADDKWIDEILQAPQQDTEILPDEDAIAAAGLTHPTENEVDLLIQEARSHIQSDADAAIESSLEATQVVQPPVKDEEYRDAFDEEEDLEAIFNTAPYVEEEPIGTDGEIPLPPDLFPQGSVPLLRGLRFPAVHPRPG